MSYILVVEDDDATAMMMEHSLIASGHKVARASDAESALAIVSGEKPALLVLDIGLPKMSGAQLLQAAKDKLAGVPVIVVTAHDKCDLTDLPPFAYTVLSKPTDFTELVKVVEKMIDGKTKM